MPPAQPANADRKILADYKLFAFLLCAEAFPSQHWE